MRRIASAAHAPQRKLLSGSLAALAALGVSLAATTPAQAAGSPDGAEKIRRLDIMLMVTGLRCRSTADDFNADYGRFTAAQLGLLNAANAELKADLARRHGAAGAQRALDRLSTTMANSYGQGHPWLSCGDLKMAARQLAAVRGRATLEEAADQLLKRDVPRLAYADF